MITMRRIIMNRYLQQDVSKFLSHLSNKNLTKSIHLSVDMPLL